MNHQCPAYDPFVASKTHQRAYSNHHTASLRHGLVQGVRSRPDVEYARHLVNLTATATDEQHWSPDGWCEKPKIEPYVSKPSSTAISNARALLALADDLFSPTTSFWRQAAAKFLKI